MIKSYIISYAITIIVIKIMSSNRTDDFTNHDFYEKKLRYFI